MQTLYDLLGASPDDDAEGLKDAFRRAVKANHPDLHPNDPDATVRLSGIVRAYAILRDAHERASYDHALGFERGPLRPKPKRTFFDRMHHIVSEAVIVAVLGVVLGGGYVLLANVLAVDRIKVAGGTAREPAKIAAVQPTARTSMTEREEPHDEPAGVVLPSIEIEQSAAAASAKSGGALEIANERPVPSRPEREVQVDNVIEGSGAPIHQADAITATDQPKKSDGVDRPDQNQNQNMARAPAEIAIVKPAAQSEARTNTTEQKESRDQLESVAAPSIGEPPPSVPNQTERAANTRSLGETAVRETTGSIPIPASSRTSGLVHTSRSPEASQRITPDTMLTEGRKADGRSDFQQINVPDLAKAEPALDQDDAHFRTIRIHRWGAEPSVYRVPRER